MKKGTFLAIMTGAAIAATAALAACDHNKPNLYPTAGVVVEVNHDRDLVVVEDGAGRLRAFIGAEDWMSGDICAMIMNDNGTENVDDDVIVSCRYTGFVY